MEAAPTSSYIYEIEIVGVYVCMFAYSSKMDVLICTKLDMLIPGDQKAILKRSKLKNNCPEFKSWRGQFLQLGN
jgi:hypothetical protein